MIQTLKVEKVVSEKSRELNDKLGTANFISTDISRRCQRSDFLTSV